MQTQAEKAEAFRALHHRDHAFIIPNPWDVGTARLLETLGFEALATTSAGFAFSIGTPDGAVGREQMLAHAAQIAAATDLPVSADLENCYADDPGGAADTVRLAAETGLAGCSIEDVSGRQGQGPYELSLAAERVSRSGGGRSFHAVFVYADGARGKLHHWAAGSARHNCAIAGFSGSWSRCAIRAGVEDEGGDRSGSTLRGSSGERDHGTAERAIESR